MKTIAFFNNKGGVGKTSLVYHLAWMFAELGIKVLAVDLDPQANLTAMFLREERLEEIWPDDHHPLTVFGAIHPILRGLGDISQPHVEMLSSNLGLIPGDLGLSRFEDKLSEAWPRCHNRDEAAFRTMTAFHRLVMQGAKSGARSGSNWGARVPRIYRTSVLDEHARSVPKPENDPFALAMLKHYRSLMPMAMDARKPMFSLRSADGAIGSHIEAVRICHTDFLQLAQRIATEAGLVLN